MGHDRHVVVAQRLLDIELDREVSLRKGIEEGYTLSDPIEENIFKMTDEEMEEKGVTSLPGSLREAAFALVLNSTSHARPA